MKNYSDFGVRFSKPSITQEMVSQTAEAVAKIKNPILMGIGNPACIPQVTNTWIKRTKEITDDISSFEKVFCKYGTSKGDQSFNKAVINLLNEIYNWNLTEKNILVTQSSQTSIFFLCNILAGKTKNKHKKILLPMCPEYCGYVDQAGTELIFVTHKPHIEKIGEHFFKYKIDFADLPISDDVSAICISRPTNPSGNIITIEELKQLSEHAKKHNCYLIIDGAYAPPFPNIVFKPFETIFEEHTILTFSLSKLGLPGTRTGIIIANEEIISRITTLNAISTLTINAIGQAIVTPLFENGKIRNLCDNIINPYYAKKLATAEKLIEQYFQGFDYRIHVPEGGFFLWLWLPNLPITDNELYTKLSAERVIITPGNYFFHALNPKIKWRHEQECIRISYALDDEVLEKGIKTIAKVVKQVYENR